MTAPVSPQRLAIDLLTVFTARAEARAILWAEGVLELHDAVDELWAAAERDGLVQQIGQDAVQAILAQAFQAVSHKVVQL